MTDIIASKQNITVEETSNNSAISESTMTRIGGSINFINENAITQIGDIMPSILNEAQFQALRSTAWILCDGRSIAGSDLATLTGLTNAPDARGRFLRMKDNGAGVNPGGDLALGAAQGGDTSIGSISIGAGSATNVHDSDYFKDDTIGGPGNGDIGKGSGLADSTPAPPYIMTSFTFTGPTFGDDDMRLIPSIKIDSSSAFAGNRKHTGAYTDLNTYMANNLTLSGGGAETRPVNVTVNYFIRINN
jgi:hypothetical protein